MADYELPDDCRYTKEDEWVRQEAGVLRVGVTDYAQQELGDIVFVELPESGSPVTRGETFGVIESVKAVSDLYSPVTGEVSETNDALADKPEAVNEDCYGAGWIIAVRASDPSEYEALMDAAAYRRFIAERKE